jgi:hypothetical protein
MRVRRLEVAPLRRPQHPIACGQQLDAHRNASSGSQDRRVYICKTGERRIESEPPMCAGESARQHGVQVGGHCLAVVEGDEVDILTEPAEGEVSPRKGRSTDELDPVTEVVTEKGQQMRDEVIALDLFGCHPEPLSNLFTFITVHAALRPMTLRDAARP